MLDNGFNKKEMVLENYFGLMVHSMKGSGLIIMQMVMEDCYIRMVTLMKAFGKMIKLTERALIIILMGQRIMEIGNKINR
jgi:hypothetical protein